MKRLSLFVITILLLLLSTQTNAGTYPINKERIPDKIRAEEIRNLRFGMFICWSFSTFAGKEYTTEPHGPEFFKARGCDTDQWARTAKEAGMNYILFLTKHHDGFCLWDTKTTAHKVTNSPLKIDVLKKVKESCDKYGLKLALYFSEGDWTVPGDRKGKRAAIPNAELKKAQLEELLTQYGDIEFIWFDHAAGNGGLSHKETVEWVHKFQPNVFCGFNHGEPAGRLSLRERGKPGKIGTDGVAPHTKNETKYDKYLLAEFTYPLLPKHKGGAIWFYSLPKHDNLKGDAQKVYKDYLDAGKYGNIFSLNIGPNYEGKLRKVDIEVLKEVGVLIRQSNK